MSALDDVRRDYRAAFLRYLGQREEAPLHSGYQIGRSAVSNGLSLLQIVQVHHDIVVEALERSRSDELVATATAASDFLLEVLATYDMTQRGFLDRTAPPEAAS